ncbi:MAG: hypothetical protein LYZ69_02525 [Nitrososphaerales archaeon]|nr:hypothetical protein [Nitrososphaerales archaeon]
MKVALGTLKDKGADLLAFLEPRVGTKPELSGESLEIDEASARKGLKPRQVKTYIKRFLYMNGLRKNYRVFVAGKELTVQELELGEEEEEKKEKVAEKVEKAEEKELEVREGEEPKATEEKKPEKAEEKKEKPKAAKEEKKAKAPAKKETKKPEKKGSKD